MKEDQQKFLTLLGKPPARLLSEQVAWLLNCQPHDVSILVAARLLKPLGSPPVNGVKFFAVSDILELSNDRAWLAKVTNTIIQHWQRKNAGKRRFNPPPSHGHTVSLPKPFAEKPGHDCAMVAVSIDQG